MSPLSMVCSALDSDIAFESTGRLLPLKFHRSLAEGMVKEVQVGAIAEEEGHHPDIYLAWGKARVRIWTHKVDGLTRSDFVLAAKIERLL